MAEGGEIPFDEWLLKIGGITEDGKIKLEKSTVVSTTAVKFLTSEDIAEIRLGVGDRGIFKAAWQSLQTESQEKDDSTPRPREPPSYPSGSDEESRMYSIHDIAKYFGSLPHPTAGNPGPSTSGSTLRPPSSDGRAEALAPAGAIGTAANTGAEITPRILAKDRLLSRLAAE
jgi:hypothetical protein